MLAAIASLEQVELAWSYQCSTWRVCYFSTYVNTSVWIVKEVHMPVVYLTHLFVLVQELYCFQNKNCHFVCCTHALRLLWSVLCGVKTTMLHTHLAWYIPHLPIGYFFMVQYCYKRGLCNLISECFFLLSPPVRESRGEDCYQACYSSNVCLCPFPFCCAHCLSEILLAS